MAFLIDTSVLVASERQQARLEDLVDPDEHYAISVVTAAELLHGVHRATRTHAHTRSAFVEAILDTFSALPVDITVARAYGYASAALARAGESVDANDLWIGATAIAHDLTVLALDGDFDRIPGVARHHVV